MSKDELETLSAMIEDFGDRVAEMVSSYAMMMEAWTSAVEKWKKEADKVIEHEKTKRFIAEHYSDEDDGSEPNLEETSLLTRESDRQDYAKATSVN